MSLTQFTLYGYATDGWQGQDWYDSVMCMVHHTDSRNQVGLVTKL